MGLQLQEIQWMYGPRTSIPVRELVEFILRNGYTPVELSIVNVGRDAAAELPINDVAMPCQSLVLYLYPMRLVLSPLLAPFLPLMSIKLWQDSMMRVSTHCP